MGRLSNVKISMLPNLIYKFKTILTKVPTGYFVELTVILKFMWKGKRPRIANTLFK